ncbi:MAG: MFS transporter [Pseudomonadota bacterium]
MKSTTAGGRRWLLWVLATVMLALQNLEVLTVGALANDLGSNLHISSGQVGALFGVYTLFYALMQLPAGLAFARFSPSILLIWACVLFSVGNVLFAVTDNLMLAYTGRVIAGVGGGLFFIGYFALTANQFDPLQFATLLGWNQLVKFLLAMLALALMPVFLSDGGDWRQYFFLLGIVFLPFIPCLWFTRGLVYQPTPNTDLNWLHGIRKDLGNVWDSTQIRRTVFMGFLGSGSIMAFTGLWYLPFAEAAGYSHTQADNLGSVLMICTGLGLLGAGWLSDKLRRRKLLLLWGMLGTLFCTLCLILWSEPPFVVEALLVALLAIFGGAYLGLLYALIKESVPMSLSSTALGLVNTAIFGGAAFMQWLPGSLLDLISGSTTRAQHASIADYQLSLLVYPPCMLVALIVGFFCYETATQTDGTL